MATTTPTVSRATTGFAFGGGISQFRRHTHLWLVGLLSSSGCDALTPEVLNFTSRGNTNAFEMDAGQSADGQSDAGSQPGASDDIVTVVFEAERYDAHDSQGLPRDFYRVGMAQDVRVLPTPDPDPSHATSASGASYLEVLPDTRVTTEDPRRDGLIETAGTGSLIHYNVAFPRAGTYFVWIRGYATGTEDKTAYLALDKAWKQAVLIALCSGIDAWQWASQERSDTASCGLTSQVRLEVPSAGQHTVSIAARDDGFELDKCLLTNDASFLPRGLGPDTGTSITPDSRGP